MQSFFSLLSEILLEQVDGYSYLGQVVSADPNPEKEIKRRFSTD